MNKYLIMTFLFRHLMAFCECFKCVSLHLHDCLCFIHEGSTLKMEIQTAIIQINRTYRGIHIIYNKALGMNKSDRKSVV